MCAKHLISRKYALPAPRRRRRRRSPCVRHTHDGCNAAVAMATDAWHQATAVGATSQRPGSYLLIHPESASTPTHPPLPPPLSMADRRPPGPCCMLAASYGAALKGRRKNFSLSTTESRSIMLRRRSCCPSWQIAIWINFIHRSSSLYLSLSIESSTSGRLLMDIR